MHFLASIEQSGFSTWIRESPSIWAYPSILFLHTIGLGFLVGTSMAIDLRVLGFSRDLPLEFTDRFFFVMLLGFCLNAASGVVLVMVDATKMLLDPVFYIKMGFIVAALVSGMLIRRQVAGESVIPKARTSTNTKMLAGASLLSWVGAITAGRLTAYLSAGR